MEPHCPTTSEDVTHYSKSQYPKQVLDQPTGNGTVLTLQIVPLWISNNRLPLSTLVHFLMTIQRYVFRTCYMGDTDHSKVISTLTSVPRTFLLDQDGL